MDLSKAVIVSPAIDAVVRAAAQGAAGYLVGAGHLDPTDSLTISGAIVSLATVIWSVIQKSRAA